MKKLKLIGLGIFIALVIFFSLLPASSFADTVISDRGVTTTTTTYPYFHVGTNPVSSIFYIVGDVAALPFKLVGNLFDGVL